MCPASCSLCLSITGVRRSAWRARLSPPTAQSVQVVAFCILLGAAAMHAQHAQAGSMGRGVIENQVSQSLSGLLVLADQCRSSLCQCLLLDS